MGSQIGSVGDADFESEVLQAGQPVLVDFWASWCAPCRMVAPVVEEVARELGGKIKVLKLDVDANPQTSQRLGVMSIPTMIIFKDGQATDRTVGYRPNLKSELTDKLTSLLA
jgi:thioredoxin 1